MLNYLKGILYDAILLLARISIRKPSMRKALIVRVDEIGDFLLWQNFICEIVESDKLKGCELHFCGNRSWQLLFDSQYSNCFTKTFWLNKIKFKKNLFYRLCFLQSIYKEKYEIVINPTFSRAKRYDDSIVKAAMAKRNIGMNRNNENYYSYERRFDKNLYSELFYCNKKHLFEFCRNKLFAEFITQRASSITTVFIPAKNLVSNTSTHLPEDYFVVFPGSRSKYRIWPTMYFIDVSNYLFERFGWTAIICGSASDNEYAERFIQGYSKPYLNLIGKTNLIEMLIVLQKAKCLLSVDTGSVHMAAAVNCAVFGIFNGSQYGRFSPYPLDIKNNIFSLYPDEVEKDIREDRLNNYELISNVPYKDVAPEKMIRSIKSYFKQ